MIRNPFVKFTICPTFIVMYVFKPLFNRPDEPNWPVYEQTLIPLN